VRGRLAHRTHFVQHGLGSSPRHLPRRFASGQPSADDVNRPH
jgi:hypothetical protein